MTISVQKVQSMFVVIIIKEQTIGTKSPFFIKRGTKNICKHIIITKTQGNKFGRELQTLETIPVFVAPPM